MNSNDNLLGKGILDARKHLENPILKNLQGGIYKAITVGGKPDPEGRGRIAAYIPKLNGDPDEPMYFNMLLVSVVQMLKVLMVCLQSHQMLV